MIRVSNSLDPDQNQHNVGPDLDPNCLQILTADDKSLARKELIFSYAVFVLMIGDTFSPLYTNYGFFLLVSYN